jgi:putative transposase
MPRPPRDNDPGSFHVTVKALGPGPYFLEPVDRLVWKATLARTLVRMARTWKCISFCQMTTHVHAIFEILDSSLSDGMRFLNGEYTRALDRMHGRRGPLLTRRFHAVRITSEAHLATTFRYDARNPVAAGACGTPQDWPHSTYASAVGLEDDDGVTDPSRVLAFFGPDADGAIRDLRDFVELPGAKNYASAGSSASQGVR